MKIKRIRTKTLLKLNLLKLKIYEQSTKKHKFSKFINLDQTIIDIKKLLQIIFQYHKAKKCILFIGFPYELEQKINQLTKHVAIPESFEIKGIISNPTILSRRKNLDILPNNLSKFLLPKLFKNLDLIVLINHRKSESIFIESKIAKIPCISFGNIEGNFDNLRVNHKENFFSICINFIFQ